MTSRRTPCLFFVFLALLLPLLASCIPATTVPIGTSSFQRSAKDARNTLLVFLPGRGDTVLSYEREGLIRTAAAAGNPDMLGVEAHLGYYRDRTLLRRLREDVILPAKADGYRDIWLVGISMGGLGAVLYDAAYPGDLSGLILMAPYLGDGTLLPEISKAGGLREWQPGQAADGDLEREIWSRLKEYGNSSKTVGRVFLGYGQEDRFAATDGFFARALPPAQVVTIPGGHDWETWKALWPQLLERSPLRASGSALNRR